MLEFEPTGWCVLLKQNKKEGTKIISIESAAPSPTSEFVVLKVGDKVTSVQVGDILVAGANEFVRAKFRGQEVFVTDQRNIWTVARDNPKAKKAVEGLTVMGIESN